jgi:hypothetical protein
VSDERFDAEGGVWGVGGEDGRADGEVDDGVAAGEARRPLRDAFGSGDGVD